MRVFALLLTAAASLVSSQAITAHFTDVDQIGGDNFVTKQNAAIAGFFDIVTGDGDTITISSPYYAPPQTFSDVAGFVPGRDSVKSAYVHFYFRDDNDAKVESVRINLDYYTLNRNIGIANMSFSIFDGDATGAIEALEIDGRLKYNIIRADGDFYFDYARLEVDASVPDGGTTAVLLGAGMLVLGAVRRKLS